MCTVLITFAQQNKTTDTFNTKNKKGLNISKTDKAPKIDGILDESVWQNAEEANNFTQFRPEMGVTEKAHQKTIVKITYDDNAIYVAAYLHDNPEDIQKQFTSRDNFGESDFFGIVFNPNNDAQNDTEFFIFSSGTQADAIASPSNGEDFGWNAVWDSAVKIVDDGWIVEVKIPYSTLRFSNQEVQTWGLQFHRRFRLDNSQYSWNPIDRSKGYVGLYHGEMKGIKNIKPPTRLSFYPFVSGLARSFDGATDTDMNVGLDLKYGITENFTLDATLIPDFSQAAFDNVSLNLGPFEQTFGEQRQFFKEGVDLFNKGDIFFSRRIGSRPTGNPQLGDDEELLHFPNEIKTLNALKVSGRTKKGLGVGFFNAITEKTEATIKNTVTGETRREVIEPLANYNILVLDQQFNGNSSVSLINTNVTRNGHFRDANVTGLLADVSNKRNTYNVRGQLKMSNLNLVDGLETGFNSLFIIRKTHGNVRYSFDHSLADSKYNINDLGLNYRNNYNNFGADVSYQIFEPTEKLNNFNVSTYINYKRLYDPGTYTGTNLGFNVNAQNKKLMWYGASINLDLGKQYDYFEPRDFENKRFFVYNSIVNGDVWFETNSNKKFSLEANLGGLSIFDKERDLAGFWLGIEPTIRFNDKFIVSYEYSYKNIKGGRGFVTNIDEDIVFGERNQLTIENSISGNYNFDSFHGLSLTFRNFWSTVAYDTNLFVLQEDGSLNTSDGYTTASIENPDINFNTWNIDFRYSWQFAPGSQLTALYRNSLFSQTNASAEDYFGSLDELLKQPMEHVFSLRLVYFIDFNNINKLFSKRSKKPLM